LIAVVEPIGIRRCARKIRHAYKTDAEPQIAARVERSVAIAAGSSNLFISERLRPKSLMEAPKA